MTATILTTQKYLRLHVPLTHRLLLGTLAVTGIHIQHKEHPFILHVSERKHRSLMSFINAHALRSLSAHHHSGSAHSPQLVLSRRHRCCRL